MVLLRRLGRLTDSASDDGCDERSGVPMLVLGAPVVGSRRLPARLIAGAVRRRTL